MFLRRPDGQSGIGRLEQECGCTAQRLPWIGQSWFNREQRSPELQKLEYDAWLPPDERRILGKSRQRRLQP